MATCSSQFVEETLEQATTTSKYPNSTTPPDTVSD